MADLRISHFVERWATSPFGSIDGLPWHVVAAAEELIRSAMASLGSAYRVEGEVATHATAKVETGAIVKGPAILGPGCFIAGTAYLRGGVYLEEDCIVGPGAELKSSFMFKGSKLAHLNFVGDSILGSEVNVEAGAIIANYRNERTDKEIRVCLGGEIIETGIDKFGALVGDGVRIGANAVVAPGALIAPGASIGRLQLVDQAPPV